MSTSGPGRPSSSVLLSVLTASQPVTSSAPVETDTSTRKGAGGSSNGGGGGGGGGGTTTSSLYLFTFLATLLLLLVISFTIVLRSFMIRRQYRRRLELALAEGYVLPQIPGSRKDFGEKPKLWDRHIFTSTEEQWQDLSPLSAKLMYNVENTADSTFAKPRSPSDSRSGILNLLARRHRQQSSNNPSPNSSNSPSLIPKEEPIGIEVSILIALPSQWSKLKPDSEEEFPDMALGVARLPYSDNSPAINGPTTE